MKFTERPLAITDVETTGLDAQLHEIIEIGLLVVDQQTLEIQSELDMKIKPARISKSAKKALAINGYNERDWLNAWELKDAMELYAEKTREAIFFAHNVYFDWSFIAEAFKKTGVEDHMDYHRLDLHSIAWGRHNLSPQTGLSSPLKLDRQLLKPINALTKFNLKSLCAHFDIPEETLPHRAINGARTELAVLRKLREL